MVQGKQGAAGIRLSRETLAHVPGCERGEQPLSVAPLPGGPVNRTAAVRTRVGRFVVRQRTDGAAALGLDPRREILLHSQAAAAGLAPRILWADPDGRTMITEYIAGAAWTVEHMGDARSLARLAGVLGRLHALPAPALEPFDPLATAERYRSCVRASDPADAAQLDAAVDDVRAICRALARDRRAPVIVHGDPAHSNVLGHEPMLVDWEYASVGEPLFDLGCLLAYYPAARVHAPLLLRASGVDEGVRPEALSETTRLYERLSLLWQRAVTPSLSSGAGRHESAD